jgi:hypothetical protein
MFVAALACDRDLHISISGCRRTASLVNDWRAAARRNP